MSSRYGRSFQTELVDIHTFAGSHLIVSLPTCVSAPTVSMPAPIATRYYT